MIAFFRLIRIANLLMIALCLSLFYYLIIVPAHHTKLFTPIVPFITQDFILFVFSVVLIAASGNIINDYFDFELDREYKPNRPLPSGAFTLNTAMYLHGLFAIAGICLGFYEGWQIGNFKIGYVYIICVLLLYLYSAYLKKIPLIGNMVVAGLAAFIFVLLMMFEANSLNFLKRIHVVNTDYVMDILLWQLRFYAGFAFLTSLSRELIKDLEDIEGDEAYNIQTLPVHFGMTAGKITAALVLFFLIAGVAYFQQLFLTANAMKQFYYLLFAVQIPVVITFGLLLRAKESKDFRVLSYLLKAIMLLGILSIPAFSLFNK